MTKPKLVFDPYSQEYFDDPYEIYRRMRDETPIYYDEEQDFYALTRHADVAAALKDHESFSSTRGCHLNMIKSGKGFQKSIIFMDPPEHRFMRSLLNKAFTPRAIQSQRDTVVELVEHYLSKVDPDNFDVVQDFSGPFPVEVITRMAGVPEEFRQQVRHWIDKGLEVKPGQVDLSEENMQANMDAGVYYFGLVQERRHDPQDDMISRLIAAEIPGENGEMRKLDDIEITGFVALLGGAGAETVTKLVGSAVVEFARHPEQWQMLLDDRSLLPAAVEELLRYVGPVQYNVRYTLKEAEVPGGTIPANKPVFLMKAAANRDPRAFDDGETFDITRDRTQAQNLGLGYGIHSCLGAALARLETSIALEHLLDFMPRFEVDFDGLQRVHMQNVAGYHHVPVKVLK
ncbi:cytochrome [Mycolicibacterium celeriflavum]|uniref:Steroid C26-monooxygenase n=1 Tax=Mycolicibacterium celeriflavum TaxID=1249101 RepID=A0A1X0BKP4_MYCCF|nr:cytochrome P450 [Mycolicibacterium celeriflavum]MCV7239729.1 cytochrome P450 [Mycolicibacterium celeriflavum]OBG19071.1 cytochrome [Mycolicibacterium celeriflavum]ORA43113.1 cytochrome P450 [Mycolicibacterium celeriflavum]BBY46543.1 cytochrome P450 [Mycolicibacterium celeriflavum]